MPGYLFRRTDTRSAPWNSAGQGGTPPDAGAVASAPPIAAAMPARAPGPLRAAVAAFAILLGPPPADAASTLIDTFTGTSGTSLAAHTPDAGGTWTAHPTYSGDTAAVSSANRARPGSGPDTQALVYWSGTPASADYSLTADATILTASGRSSLCARLDTTAETYYFARVQGGTLRLELGKRVAGSETIFGSVLHGWVTGSTHSVTLSVSGTTVSLWTSGTLLLTATDSSIAAAGKVGLGLESLGVISPDTKQVHLDNLTLAAALVNPDPPTPPWIVAPWLSPRRAAAAAYQPHQQTTPRDAGLLQPAPAPSMPDRAPGRARAAGAAYWLANGTPNDPGARPIPGSFPDRAAVSRRWGQVPGTPPPPDSGAVATAPPIGPEYPDRAPGRARAVSAAYWPANDAVPDPGTSPIVGSMPDRTRGFPYRTAAYTLPVASPRDAGAVANAPPIAGSFPDRAPGPRARTHAAGTRSPVDAGILPPGPVAPSMPDRARAAPRAANHAYSVLVRSPRDAGLAQPIVVPVMPSRAPGPRRAAPSAYAITVPARQDIGVLFYYDVYANTGTGDPIDYTAYVARQTGLTWTSGVLTFPAVWKFGVRVLDGAISLEELNVDAVVTLRLDAAGVDISTIPIAPTNLAVSQLAGGGLRLAWIYPTPQDGRSPTGFRAYCAAGGVISYASVAATVAWLRGTAHYSADITPLAAGPYTLAVRAYNAAGTEAGTATIAGTVDTTAPDSPDSLTITTEAEEAD